jgi:threonine dehydrogenase-like Zn-dependent dehydrogenase
MKALTWHGRRDVRVETVPDPVIEDPADVIIEVTSTGLRGSDLHLYEVLGPFLTEGDILGHEPMGVVREVGSEVGTLHVGDRVVVPAPVAVRVGWDATAMSGRSALCGSRRLSAVDAIVPAEGAVGDRPA